MTKTEERKQFLVQLLYYIVVIALVLGAAYLAFRWLLPFVLAFLTAAAIQRPLRWMVRKTRLRRSFVSFLAVSGIVLLLAVLIALIVWQLAVWVIGFVTNPDKMAAVQDYATNLVHSVQSLLDSLSSKLSASTVALLQDGLAHIGSSFLSLVSKAVADGASFLMTFVVSKLPAFLLDFFIWILASILLAVDYETVVMRLTNLLPKRRRPVVSEFRRLCGATLFKLLRAYGLLMLITFVELTIGLYLLGIPSAILWSGLIALVDILPILGVGTVLVPWSVIQLLSGNLHMAIGLFVLFCIISLIRNLIEPRIVSQQIGLHPLATVFFMYLGLQSCGLIGLFAFPVLAMIVKQLKDTGFLFQKHVSSPPPPVPPEP